MNGQRKINAVNFRRLYFDENKSQSEMVLDYINRYGSITSDEAYEACNSRRLAAVIFNLRKKYNVVTDIDKKEHIAIYRISQE